MKSLVGVCKKVDCTISLPLKEIPRPISTKNTVEKVIIPNPPIWKRKMVITWPRMDRSFPISMTTNPVTQTAEAEVKSASTKVRGSFVTANGKERKMAPMKITPAKLRTKILVGGRCLEKNVLIRIRIFIGIENSFPPMRA
jgi:hypothetical protein